ncbi:cdk-activating kinase assembly factor mat1 [Phtheirospermum japonicum]|uniref:Cdk-activating kinase assembly factor mat1 n=1 Tax=Phtheirospermum japonicum TaxID=374723 RepID=A0A830B9H6_9LAMI|nr:cdk-activating kinase assembly factor mat1 [Phtheirospermum japonicum]
MVVASGNAFAKEMAIRKRIASIYNKREEDFASLKEYNDYLEEVEDMIVNLVDGIDVPSIEARIAQYQRENADQIMNAQARKAEEYAAALAASKGQLPQTGVDLSSSSQEGTSGIAQGQYAPAIAGSGIGQPRPMGQPLPLGPGHDPLGLDYEDEETMKLRAEKAARAGGWSVEMSKKRALEEAFSSIWI